MKKSNNAFKSKLIKGIEFRSLLTIAFLLCLSFVKAQNFPSDSTIVNSDSTFVYSSDSTFVYGGDSTFVYGGDSTFVYDSDSTFVTNGDSTFVYGSDSTTVVVLGGDSIFTYGSDSIYVYNNDTLSIYTGTITTEVFGADSVIVYGGDSTFVYGSDSTFVYGGDSTFVYGSDSTFVYGSDSTFVYGSDSTFAFGSDSIDIVNGFIGSPPPITASIKDITLLQSFSLYPNPATDKLILRSEEKIKLIRILDITGKETLVMGNVNFSDSLLIDINNLTIGTYIIEIGNDKNEKAFKKFIKIEN